LGSLNSVSTRGAREDCEVENAVDEDGEDYRDAEGFGVAGPDYPDDEWV